MREVRQPSIPQIRTCRPARVCDPEGMSDERLITIVVFDGMKLLDLAGPAEVFAEANRFGANYRLVVASVDGRDVSTSIGSPFSVIGVVTVGDGGRDTFGGTEKHGAIEAQ
ncbi:Putative transcription regulator, AraC family [Mycobacteroides abscessus subsp. bolletii]|nr:Putative transcription regulator, AraC family [Mycobacteroides abscessus subsp. bolletii]